RGTFCGRPVCFLGGWAPAGGVSALHSNLHRNRPPGAGRRGVPGRGWSRGTGGGAGGGGGLRGEPPATEAGARGRLRGGRGRGGEPGWVRGSANPAVLPAQRLAWEVGWGKKSQRPTWALREKDLPDPAPADGPLASARRPGTPARLDRLPALGTGVPDSGGVA